MKRAILRFASVTTCKRGNRLHSTLGQTRVRSQACNVKKSCLVNFTDTKFYARFTKVEVNNDKDTIDVILLDGSCLQYPWVWLRDNCQCPSCFIPHLHSRTIHWKYFDVTVKPTKVDIDDGKLHVSWSDGHSSQFELGWLRERNFSKETQEAWLNDVYRLPKVPWGSAEFPNILKRFNFQDIVLSDNVLLDWLENLAMHGVAIITDTPCKEDQIRHLANRVCFIKKTHYGEEFEVRNKPDTTNLAYLSTPLQMHTDLPYYEYKPGVNLLHCLVQTVGEGGENELTDILNVSNKLRRDKPEEYKILTKTLVEWSDIGEERGIRFHSLYRSPVICEDLSGKFERVNYSQQQRDSHFSVPLEDVVPWYRAHAVFTEALYHPDNIVKFKTNPDHYDVLRG
ncbi:gamma-butyrobetaine dioxygenase [Anabrus simplex]|uniref:gamma-butyrobetaine dioxygenase n=1 Tax=Anabrus simplex TaxID=316456 RepID=UPI0035A354F3